MRGDMARLCDPLHDREWRITGYALLTVFFGRLTAWYWIERRWGKP